MLSFLYVYSDHSVLECYNLFSGVELSMRSFFVIIISKIAKIWLTKFCTFNFRTVYLAQFSTDFNNLYLKIQFATCFIQEKKIMKVEKKTFLLLFINADISLGHPVVFRAPSNFVPNYYFQLPFGSKSYDTIAKFLS